MALLFVGFITGLGFRILGCITITKGLGVGHFGCKALKFCNSGNLRTLSNGKSLWA